MNGTCAVCGAPVQLRPPDPVTPQPYAPMPHRWHALYCSTARFGYPEADYCSAACALKAMRPQR